MQLESFMECVYSGEIPPEAPDGLTAGGWEWDIVLGEGQSYRNYSRARTECLERGMWAIVDLTWTCDLAEWIGKRRVLEIMVGRGWLAKALASHGVEVIATDSGAWDSSHTKTLPVFEVKRLDAVEAVKTFGTEVDVLLVSWPPCGDAVLARAAEIWGSDRPLIYIGEGRGGRNAPNGFFRYFKALEDLDFPLKSWYGFYDRVAIGYYRADKGATEALANAELTGFSGFQRFKQSGA